MLVIYNDDAFCSLRLTSSLEHGTLVQEVVLEEVLAVAHVETLEEIP